MVTVVICPQDWCTTVFRNTKLSFWFLNLAFRPQINAAFNLGDRSVSLQRVAVHVQVHGYINCWEQVTVAPSALKEIFMSSAHPQLRDHIQTWTRKKVRMEVWVILWRASCVEVKTFPYAYMSYTTRLSQDRGQRTSQHCNTHPYLALVKTQEP